MAATVLIKARYIPRTFSSIATCRHTFGKSQSQVRLHKRCLNTATLGARSAQAVRIFENDSIKDTSRNDSGQLYAKWTSSRPIHTSRALYEDIRTVHTPPFADSVSEGDVRWDKAVGDAVSEDEVIGGIETDKTELPIHAPAAGIIEEFLVADGNKVTANSPLLKLRVTGDAPPPKAAAPAVEKPEEPVAAAPSSPPPPPPASPTATPPSSTAGPIPTTPPPVPTMPAGPISSKPASDVKATPVTTAPPGTMPIPSARSETRTKMSRMRLKIAQRLKDAQNTCAMLTTFNEIDMSNCIEARNKYKDAFVKKHNVKLGFMSTFIKASAYALQDLPAVNAVIDDNEIIYRDYVDISVAVATPKGLVVPVLRNVETMNYADIEKGLNALGEKAKTGELAIEDMDGGTFTISNGGVFGSLMGTPIINPPQSAILGMHGIFDRPVAVKGQVEVRPMMYVALTYDHRLIDGREAVTFLRKIKSAVEDPTVMFLDL